MARNPSVMMGSEDKGQLGLLELILVWCLDYEILKVLKPSSVPLLMEQSFQFDERHCIKIVFSEKHFKSHFFFLILNFTQQNNYPI